MKNNKMAIILLLFFAFMTVTCHAASAGYGTPTITSGKDIKGRIEYAKLLLSFFEKIDSQIPSLSPSQKQWLNNELSEFNKTRNINRFLEITNTKEFNINSAKKNISDLDAILSSIIDSKDGQKHEIYLWSLVADNLLNRDFCDEIIVLIYDYKLINKSDFITGDSQYANKSEQMDVFYLQNGVIPAQFILRNIIEPYLKEGK